MYSLSQGAIESICNGETVEKPIFQIDAIKKVPGEKEKNRLSINDGQQTFSCVMLAPKYNDLVTKEELKMGSVIQVDKYLTKRQGNKTIILLTEIVLLERENVNFSSNMEASSHESILNTSAPLTNKPVIQNTMTANRVPIQFINSYMNAWVINGRVVSKQQIRTWSKPTGDGKLFSFDIADETCDIRITCFNKEVDRYFDMIELNKTYSVSKAQVRPAKRPYNRTKCDYELVVSETSEIRQIISDDNSIPMIQHKFVEIDKIKDCDENSQIDVLGIVHEIGEISSIISKTTNAEIPKRNIVLVDRSLTAINMTLWRDKVHMVDNCGPNPTIIVKNANVSGYNGRSLNSNDSLQVNCTSIPEVVSLAGWYAEEGHQKNFQMITSGMPVGSGGAIGGSPLSSQISTISELSSHSDRGDFFSVVCSVTQVKQKSIVYKACTSEGCNKKLDESHPGSFYCQKCEKSIDDYRYRMMLSFKIADFSDAKWVMAFHEAAELILGCSAQDIGKYQECQEDDKIDEIIKKSLFEKYTIRVRCKMETFQDESRLKIMVMSAEKLDLLGDIARMSASVAI